MRDKDVFYEKGYECVHTTYQKTFRPFYQINVLNRHYTNGKLRDPLFLGFIPDTWARCD